MLGRTMVVALVLADVAGNPSMLAGELVPQELACEHLIDPLGIDAAPPRLSWSLRAEPADRRGQVQTAYQVLVASRREALAADLGDLWDSGKVASDRTSEVIYAGRDGKSPKGSRLAVSGADRAMGEIPSTRTGRLTGRASAPINTRAWAGQSVPLKCCLEG